METFSRLLFCLFLRLFVAVCKSCWFRLIKSSKQPVQPRVILFSGCGVSVSVSVGWWWVESTIHFKGGVSTHRESCLAWFCFLFFPSLFCVHQIKEILLFTRARECLWVDFLYSATFVFFLTITLRFWFHCFSHRKYVFLFLVLYVLFGTQIVSSMAISTSHLCFVPYSLP
jgi:hypothetical protein